MTGKQQNISERTSGKPLLFSCPPNCITRHHKLDSNIPQEKITEKIKDQEGKFTRNDYQYWACLAGSGNTVTDFKYLKGCHMEDREELFF